MGDVKVHRLAVVELRPAPSALRRRPIVTSAGLDVHLHSFEGSADRSGQPDPPAMAGPTVTWGRSVEQAPCRAMLIATQPLDLEDLVEAGQIRVQLGATRHAERALSEAANLLAIASQSQQEVFSPRPYLFLQPESSREVQALGAAGRIDLPPLRTGGSIQAPGADHGLLFAGLLADRPHGVSLMGAALGAGHGVGKLHELVRVLESGFAVSGNRLVDPLTEFLSSYPGSNASYGRGEVRRWLKDLRDPATHADLRFSKHVVLDPDVEADLPRIEQAAYDVLLNKKGWNHSDSAREQRWSFPAITRRDGSVGLTTPRAVLRTHDQWDHQNAFRLNERYRINVRDLSADWHPVDWYFATPSDSD